MSCSMCYYFMNGKGSPNPAGWCGWRGGEQDSGGSCLRYDPTIVPAGLAIAKSRRIVRVEDLALENEAFSDVTGRGGYGGF
ncbi:MAG: hypothetical protein BMS9Abin34_248 [Patescibacteria group bacterium]|nr:MAG: hypothetical protein BMS9Abin34_248 [Patescibacteria group bacterium]